MKIQLTTLQQLQSEKKLRVLIGKTPYLIVLVGEKPYMIPDTCPHQDASLYEGTLQGTCVTCPLHKATFDVVTGDIDEVSKMLYFDFGPEKITTYPLGMDGDSIYVDWQETI